MRAFTPPLSQSGATRWRVMFAFEVELDFEAITDEHHSLRVLFYFILFYFIYLFIYLFIYFLFIYFFLRGVGRGWGMGGGGCEGFV